MTGKKKATTPTQTSNKTKGSLVKVVVIEDLGKWIRPNKGDTFHIDENAAFPDVTFEIDTAEPPPYNLTWTMSWEARVSGLSVKKARGALKKTFTENGRAELQEKTWKATFGKVIGGLLTVQVKAGEQTFKRSVTIKGKNPGEDKAKAYLTTIDDIKGFEKVLAQESKFNNFIELDGQPIVAFDNGYGMTQLTNPAPTFEQAWSWKRNIDGGCQLYQAKQREAKSYLGQQKRTYTEEQLKLETWSRWNGGSYHEWDAASKLWRRKDTILCDTATGNIGWDTTSAENKGKTEAELHKRDSGEYRKPPAVKKWKYTGICYADHLNEE